MITLFLLILSVFFNACSSKQQAEYTSFVEAKPVWSEGRECEKNLTLSFREVVNVGFANEANIRLTASCDYRLRVNGRFVAHGPCVAAHDYYRIDAYDLKPYLRPGNCSPPPR